VFDLRTCYCNAKASWYTKSPYTYFGRPYFIQTSAIKNQVIKMNKSSEIINDFSLLRTQPLSENEKINKLLSHFLYKTPWEETGLYQALELQIKNMGGSYKGLKNLQDITKYYSNIDKMYASTKEFGLNLPDANSGILSKFRTQPMNGIFFALDDNGLPYFTGRGSHRLAASIAANSLKTPGYLIGISKLALINQTWKKFILS
jgi:hypothetical protein